jgi:putative transposase
METRLFGHGDYRTEYHIVWITKYRRRILNSGAQEYISKLFPKIMKEMPGCEIIEKNIQVEHIHMLMVIPPKYAVSDVIGEIKQYTASKIREKFALLEKVYWKEFVVWSLGYFVSAVGLDEKHIKE